MTARVGTAFFCVCNARDFAALVALINSIREVGHTEPFYLTDCGLTDEQRRTLHGHVTFIEAPTGLPPASMKCYGPLTIDPEAAVVLDADVILLKPLTDLIDSKPVFFVDPLVDRFNPQWERLGYGSPRKAPHVNSGHFILPRGSGFLPLYQEAIERALDLVRADPALSIEFDAPFFLLDQDALNALLGSLDPESYVISDEAAYWPFDVPAPRARLMHHITFKPWLMPLRGSPYTQQMVRLLQAGPVEVSATDLPIFLRQGLGGTVARKSRSARAVIRSLTRGKLGIRAKLGGPLRSPHLKGLSSNPVE